jgi:hypothetical protein
MRRRKAGGSSGLALVLVGALGWSVLGGGSGVSRLDPTTDDDRKQERSLPAYPQPLDPTPTAQPSASAGAPSPGTVTAPGTGGYTGLRPTVGPSTPVVTPTRKPGGGNPGRRYAARPEITREEAMTNTDPNCATSTDAWCAYARVDESQAIEDKYTLEYTICRPRFNTSPGTLDFAWHQEIEFKAVDTAHRDTVWTYSLGVRRVSEPETLAIDPGTCVLWHMVWDGYDDFGLMPPYGSYTLIARPLSRENVGESQATFTHQ